MLIPSTKHLGLLPSVPFFFPFFFSPLTQCSDFCQKIPAVIWSPWFEVMSMETTPVKCTFKKLHEISD